MNRKNIVDYVKVRNKTRPFKIKRVCVILNIDILTDVAV